MRHWMHIGRIRGCSMTEDYHESFGAPMGMETRVN